MKHLLKKTMAGALALSMLAACSGTETTDNAQLEADISPVLPKMSGTVLSVRVRDNQYVQEGDTLLTLDDASYRLAVRQAELNLATARQQLQLAQNGATVANLGTATAANNSEASAAGVLAARANVAAAEVRLNLANKNLQRTAALLDSASTTAQQYDLAKAEQAAAAEQLSNARSQLKAQQQLAEAAKTTISQSKAGEAGTGMQIAMARLAVERAAVQLEDARLQLSYCVVKAPASGIVSKKAVQRGQEVSAGQPLMAVVNQQQVWVIANFKETQIGRMRPGTKATVAVDAYKDQTFEASIESVAQATGARFSLLPPDNATGNFVKVTQRVPVKLVLTDSARAAYPLRAGMSVSVSVKTD